MRMRSYRFTVAMHEDFGTLGFKPSWYPAGDPLGGMAVAHDILEHFPKDDGSAEGEWQALGAALWIRGDGGLFSNHSPEEHIAADLPMVWSIQSHARKCGLSRNSGAMDQAREAVAHWVRESREEAAYGSRGREEIPTEEQRENVARWIAKGYHRAEIRYSKNLSLGACQVAYDLFKPIQEAADKVLLHADEGMVLTVRVSLNPCKVRVDCDYPTEER